MYIKLIIIIFALYFTKPAAESLFSQDYMQQPLLCSYIQITTSSHSTWRWLLPSYLIADFQSTGLPLV